MSFQQGLSGLNTSSKSLDVISNNVANSSTVGFKSAQAQFADVYASALSGAVSSIQIGIGASVNAVRQAFSQGNLSTSANPLDMAINGNGFFRMERTDGSIAYTRNGQFDVDKDGYIVNANADKVTGFAVQYQAAGSSVFAGTPTAIQIDTSNIPPQATRDGVGGTGYGATVSANLDSRTTVPTNPTFDPAQLDSYTSTTSMNVYDSLGNAHTLALYYVHQDPAISPNTWNVYATMDGGSTVVGTTTMNFNTDGTLSPTSPTLLPISAVLSNGATTPLTFNVDLTASTQYGAAFAVNTLAQTGYTTGQLSGLTVTKDGVIQGRYSNGQSQDIGKIALANFQAPNGLISLGNNLWAESPESGPPIIGSPGTGVLGSVSAGMVEESNVDLTAQLVDMIIQQRNYQANAQSIKTQDQILQTLVNLR